MRSATTSFDKLVAEAVGVTVQGLKHLARQKADGKPINDVIGSALYRRGMVDLKGMATENGEQALRLARQMGW